MSVRGVIPPLAKAPDDRQAKAAIQTPFPIIKNAADYAEVFEDSRETIARLEVYADTLRLWQKRINLVSPATIPDLWHRHIADSAQILDLAPPSPKTWVDLGSGAGFPGLVVAIRLAGREALTRVTLVESDQRKCAFMGEVVRKTGIAALISVDILCARIEADATRAKLAVAEVVSARALASLDSLFDMASPLLGPASVSLFMKGRGVDAEIESARQKWVFSHDVIPSRSETSAGIVRVNGPVVRAEG